MAAPTDEPWGIAMALRMIDDPERNGTCIELVRLATTVARHDWTISSPFLESPGWLHSIGLLVISNGIPEVQDILILLLYRFSFRFGFGDQTFDRMRAVAILGYEH
jgi:hypothetical protein